MYYFLSFFFLTTFICSKDDELLFVHVHFRHGARSPISLNAEGKDYFNNTWEFPGELTPSGKRMEYILGLVLRKKYLNDTHFLSEQFDPREIYLISSDINRTIQSAYSMLQGLYKNNRPELNEKQIEYAVAPVDLSDPEIQTEIEKLGKYAIANNTNVIPLHLYNVKEHRFLLQDPPNCETLSTNHKKNLRNMKSIHEMVKKFKDSMFKNYTEFFNKSGITEDKLDFLYISTFADQFVSGYYNNKDFNTIKKEINNAELKEILNLSNEILKTSIRDQAFANGTDDSALMSSSPVFREMLTFMNRSTLRPEKLGYSDCTYPKIYFVSGHDSSVGGAELLMQKVFNLPQEKYHHPFYASNIRFELYKNNSVNATELYYVKYYFQEELIQVWNYTEFNRTLWSKLFTDEKIAEFCNFKSYGITLLLWTVIILIIFCVFTVIGIIYLYISQKKKIENKNNGVNSQELLPNQENITDRTIKL